MRTVTYKTQGTCSQFIKVTVDDNNVVQDVQFVGGCNGNLQGISSLVRGMKVDDVIGAFEGVDCHGRGTSCPDQISRALKAYRSANL